MLNTAPDNKAKAFTFAGVVYISFAMGLYLKRKKFLCMITLYLNHLTVSESKGYPAPFPMTD